MQLLSMLKKDLRLLIHKPGDMITLFLLPLAFILPVSFALGSGDGYGIKAGDRRTVLPLINYDNGSKSEELITMLEESFWIERDYSAETVKELDLICNPGEPACTEQIANRLVERSKRDAAIIIPTGFTQNLESGKAINVTLLYDPAADTITLQRVQGILEGTTQKISVVEQLKISMGQLLDTATFLPETSRQSIETEQTTPNENSSVRLITIQPTNFTLEKTPDTYQQTIPGYTVMYVFFLISYLSSSIQDERRLGTFRRLLHTPASKVSILGGKLFTSVLIGLFQVGIMFLVGALLFNLDLGRDWFALFLVTVALALTATSLGLVASISARAKQLMAPFLIIFALLGGCMFPIDLMPPFLRVISLITPHHWALVAFQNLMVRGQGLVQVLPQIGVLLGFSLILFIISIRNFEFTD